MRKILLPTIDYPPARGGVARYIGAIEKTYPDQIRVLRLEKKMTLSKLLVRFAWHGRGVDAIWSHHVLPIGTAAWIWKKLSGKPYVIFLHGLDFDLARRNAWKRKLTKSILLGAERIVTNSHALAKEVMEFAQADRVPLVVYPTVEDAFLSEDVAAPTHDRVNLQKLAELAAGVARSQTPMFTSNTKQQEDRPLRLLTVARLVERKGHLKVLAALEKLNDVHYHIVGDGPMLGEVEAEIDRRGLRDRVTVRINAKDEDLPEIYRQSDIFVMPTTKTKHDREGFGIVYLEAQLFGLPVIATNHPGVDEAVHDGEGGLLIADTERELVRAIERLRSASARERLGARGRERVLRDFTREKQMAVLRELLV